MGWDGGRGYWSKPGRRRSPIRTRKNSRPHGMAYVGGCLGPAEQHGEEQFRAGKRDQPEAPRRAPSQTPHRMARRPGMEAMEPPRSKRAAGEDQASAVESGDYITGGSYSPHRGVAGEPGCRYALDLPRHEGSNR